MKQLSSSVVSIQDIEEEILGLNPHRPGRNGLKFHYLEIEQLNLPDSSHMVIVKEAVWNISTLRTFKLVVRIIVMGRFL